MGLQRCAMCGEITDPYELKQITVTQKSTSSNYRIRHGQRDFIPSSQRVYRSEKKKLVCRSCYESHSQEQFLKLLFIVIGLVLFFVFAAFKQK